MKTSKFFQVTYSNYYFRTEKKAVKAANKKDAISQIKHYEGNSRFADAKAEQITEDEFYQLPYTTGRFDEIRF